MYETVVIVDAMIPDEAIVSEFDAIAEKISAQGNLVKLDKWGRKKLAYEINGKTHGEYGVFYYEGSRDIPALLEKGFRINENILRWLTIADNPVGIPEDKEVEESEEAAGTTKEASEVSNEEK
jgi:small subunit ribosomal protein S6